MKAYWITAGVGALVAIIGIIVYVASSHTAGIILIAGGLIAAVLGLAMRLLMGAVGDKLK